MAEIESEIMIGPEHRAALEVRAEWAVPGDRDSFIITAKRERII
jgi:hypothetical protein